MSKREPTVEHDGLPHYEDINTPLIFMLTAIAAIVTYALVAAITGLYHHMKRDQQALINAQSVSVSAQIIADQKTALAKGDAEKKIVPITDAMKATVTQLGGTWQTKPEHSETEHEHGDHDHHTEGTPEASSEEHAPEKPDTAH